MVYFTVLNDLDSKIDLEMCIRDREGGAQGGIHCNSARQRRLCQNPGRLESAAKGDSARSGGVPDFVVASLRGKSETKTVGYYLSVAGQ